MIAIDIETVDPFLKTLGDGSIRKDGCIICIGLYDGTDGIVVTPDDSRLKDWLSSAEDKVFHNGVYDLSWLICGYGFEVNGVIHDTMTRTSLIDEYTDLDLDSCCDKFNVKGKNKQDTLDKWAQEHGIKNIWQCLDIVYSEPNGKEAIEKYCLQDCKATYNLWMAQEKAIISQELQESYKMECDLYPIVMEMKKNGIRVDLNARDAFTHEIETKLKETERVLLTQFNLTPENVNSPKQLGLKLNALGIQSPKKTPTGSQSWNAEALTLINHPVVEYIQQYKTYIALVDKYLKSALVDFLIGDRIHCTFSPNKRTEGGTITGRFASSKPNMQNIPARDTKLDGTKGYGQEMRQLFIPESGCMMGAFDYSQIEYLLLAHYAFGPQAEWFRKQAKAGVDFHTLVMGITGIKDRTPVKRLNYSVIYGAGINSLIEKNQKTFEGAVKESGKTYLEYCNWVYKTYHEKFTVVKSTMQHNEELVKQLGYIRSIGGRLHHKPKPEMGYNGRYSVPYYKMTNYLIQGAAAEILKKGLLDAWSAGVFNILKLHVTVHDENVVSIPYNKIGTEAAIELEKCMNDAYKERLLVPMKAVGEVGPNWGYWSDDIWKDMKSGIFNRSVL